MGANRIGMGDVMSEINLTPEEATAFIASLQAELAEARETITHKDNVIRNLDELRRRTYAAETALAEARGEIANSAHDALRLEVSLEAAESALADKTAALNTAEAEVFELRRLTNGLAQSLREQTDCRLSLKNCTGDHEGYRCCNSKAALTAYTAYLERGETL